MKRFGLVLAVMALVVVAAKPAASQNGTRLHVGAGLVMPMSDWGDADKMGFSGGLGASFGLGTAPVRLRVEGSWTQTSHDGIDGNTRVLGGAVSLVYPFPTQGNVKPYIVGGIGFNSTKLSSGGADTSKSSVGFGGGLGLTIPLSTASFYIEGRYLTHKAFDVTFAQFPITVGLSFPVGGKKM